MELKQLEQAVINAAAGALETYKSQIEAVAGPFVLQVVDGAVKVADGVFANLPLGFGHVIDAALHKYVSVYEKDLPTYEGQGIDALAALLKKIAAGL